MSGRARLVATVGGLGRLPGAPGTAGALAGLAAGTALALAGGLPALLAGTAVVLAAGWTSCGAAARELGGGDPPQIVVDEVAGQMVALLGFAPRLLDVTACFVLFRLFDVLKPPPVRQAERLPGGSGIMADDLIAGLCANAAWRLVRWLFELA